jgi:D-alanyl-D-alanine dipeptidase
LIVFHAAALSAPSQRRWQKPPVSQTRKQGFVNYSKQWRHFSMPGAGGSAYDFPIKPR